MLKEIFNIANFYIFFWTAYYLLGALGLSGGFLTQSILLGLLLISIYNAFYAVTKYKLPIYFRGLNSLLLMFCIYGTYLIFSGEHLMIRAIYEPTPNYNYLKTIFISLLPIYSAYVYTRRRLLSTKTVKFWVVVWIIIASIAFFMNRLHELSLSTSADEITNNTAYSFIAIIPILILFYKSPLILFPSLLYCLVFILLGMKRGAILIAIILLVYTIFNLYKLESARLKKYIVFFSIIVFCSLIAAVDYMLTNSDYFISRIELTLEGNSSGRGDLYGLFISYFLNQQSLINILFGNGANATLQIGPNYAHNDWLELLINQGLLGIFIYLLYFYYFVKICCNSNVSKVPLLGLRLILITSFLATIFSMSYMALEIFTSVSLGFYMAMIDKAKSNY